ncbi:hypothetical protein OPQ81_009130 [Rhizoctonia solani]|nr:hypothetical protein OPQ81_009130 [Rhizoctonia solani]
MRNIQSLKIKDLSSELIIHILHCCECLTILRFAATCKAYHELVEQSASLQLHIELETNGLELAKGSFRPGATYSTILEELKQFRNAWLDLSIGQPTLRIVGGTKTLHWELAERFYVKAFSQTGGRLADAIQFIPLESEKPDPPPLRFDFQFETFTTDPEQGLVALVSRNLGLFTHIYVDLFSIETGLAHPLAQHPRLTAEFDFERPFFSADFTIKIMGNVVLTKVSHSRFHIYEILIWDWRFGNVLNRINSRAGICDLSFLDQYHLVLLSATCSGRTRLDTLELLVYAIHNDTFTENDLPPGQLGVTDLSLPPAIPILRLAFPPIHESHEISNTAFTLCSDPTPGRILYQKSAAFACPYTVTLSATFCFRTVNTGWEGPDYYRAFIDGRFLLNQLLSLQIMRIFPRSPTRISQACPAPLDHLEHDFDTSATHRVHSHMVGADNPSRINGIGFKEHVTSRLPYRVVFPTNNKIDHEGCQVNINGGFIVGISTREPTSETVAIYKLKM